MHCGETKQNGQLNWTLGECENAPRVGDAIAGYKVASWTVVARIQSRIKARRCAANLVKLSGQLKLSELKNFFPETIMVRRVFFLPI